LSGQGNPGTVAAMKGKPDYYWRKSKEQGYPARSVFKLQEIQEKLRPLRAGQRVLDLGASPGSWSLFIMNLLSGSGSVTGVDLNPPDAKLLAHKGYHFIQGDLTSEEVGQRIAEQAPFDAVVSDAAPQTSGNRTTDTARSAELVRTALDMCERFLAPGGNCVVKIFQGGEEQEILARMRSLFGSARAFKPKASRSDSMETYFIGMGFAGTPR
jgi:23S rRNA (uridine2552-2'-O)-methyltransferase